MQTDWNDVVNKDNVIAVDYIIYVDTGGDICARNGKDGDIRYRGTDAATVIQDAINDPSGESFFFKTGVYELNSVLMVPSGRQYIFDGEKGATLYNWKSPNLMIVGDKNDYINGLTIKNVTLQGAAGVIDLLTLRNTLFANIDNVSFSYFKNGVIFDPYGANNYAYYGQVKGCDFKGGGVGIGSESCIKFTGTLSWSANANQIIGGRFRQSDVGINIEYGEDNVIIGADLTDCGIGIKLGSGRSRYNKIIGNRGEGNSLFDIQLLQNSVLEEIVANTFVSTKTVSDAGSNIKYWNNIGYITENNVLSGTFAIGSAGIKTVTIPHELSIVPAVQDCCLTVVQNTTVDDWTYNTLKIVSTNAINVIVKINISAASRTASATAKLVLRVGKT